MSFGPPNSRSSYLAPEFSFPVDADQEKVRELIAIRERVTASIINIKTNGQFQKVILLNGEQWFTTAAPGQPNNQRYGYRVTVDMGTVASGGTSTKPHGIDFSKVTAVTRMFGGALEQNGGGFMVPIPYASVSALANQIELFADPINVTVINGAGQFALTQCYVVIEFLQQ